MLRVASFQSRRKKYNLEPEKHNDKDFFVYCCCAPCALNQDVRQYAKSTGKAADFGM